MSNIEEEEDDEHPNTPAITIEMEMEWLNEIDLSAFRGEWIAIFGLEIIAHGKKLADVVQQVRAQLPSDMIPRYMMIPEGCITMGSSCLDCFFDRPNECDCSVCPKKVSVK